MTAHLPSTQPQFPQQQPGYPGSQQQPYPGAYSQPVYAKPTPVKTTVAETNTYALVAILLAFIMPLAGLIFGHMALGQIKRTGDTGRGLALTAVIYGYCILVVWALLIIFYIGMFALMFGTMASSF